MRVCAGTQRWVPDVVYKLTSLVAACIGAVVNHPAVRQKAGMKWNDGPCHDRTEYAGDVCPRTTNGNLAAGWSHRTHGNNAGHYTNSDDEERMLPIETTLHS